VSDSPSFGSTSILYIGSESYDAPTITVLQGLRRLGWTIYTYRKPNINSWFCNEIVDTLDGLDVAFALSNLHWGTRWSLYAARALAGIPRVLIDGDDSLPGETWRDRHRRYTRDYGEPPDDHEELLIQPHRWMEPLGGYEPDVVFTSQRQFGDGTVYLPFGIHEEYLALGEDRPLDRRPTDALYVAGPGPDRTAMTRFLRAASTLHLTPRRTVISDLRGDDALAPELADLARRDDGVHGYYRWIHSRVYFEALNEARMLVYAPPVATSWDSKRPWEAIAAGALPLMLEPRIDMSDLSLAAACPQTVCRSRLHLLGRLRRLARSPEELDEQRRACRSRALELFTPEPVARSFLAEVARRLGL
jgi:hypothetical protein